MKKIRMGQILLMVLLFCCIAVSCKEELKAAAKTQALAVVYHKEGLRPSTGNYARIKVNVSASGGTNATLLVRVLNTKGQYLFQKKYTGITSNRYFDIKWSGKAAKDNTAGLKENQCPGTGNYRVQATTYYTSGGTKITSKKTVYLPIKYTVTSGKAALKNLTYVQMLTGNKDVDYLAAIMCNAAGVKASMTQDAIVKRIYHWITLNFKHVHYNMSNTYTKYYNVTNLTSKINSYRTKVNSRMKDGSVVFNYYKPSHIAWNIERRIGQCNTHAAVFKIMCNHMGIEADICQGYYLNRNGTRAGHYWNSAVVNGTRYYYDVDVELQNLGRGQGDYYWYKKTRKEAELTHEFH